MRCFIALEFPEHVKAKIFHEFDKLAHQNLFEGKLTDKNNLHLTLKFLGDLSEEQIEEIAKKLEKIKFASFNCEFGKAGIFDDENHIRITWVELISKELMVLQQEIEEVSRGYSADNKKFTPHVTVFRVKSVRDKNKLIEEIKKIHLKKLNFELSEFVLMKSELKRDGPTYKVIKKFKGA